MKTNSEYHSKNVAAEPACAYCENIFEHAAWCATRDPQVAYAYRIVEDASKLTAGDSLMLHSLGVAWVETGDTGI
ncbi:MAG TPA: hypothetical protein VGM18_18965 [Candidatus Sulfotelmatobacter sp.]|jgi:hypothetical protein